MTTPLYIDRPPRIQPELPIDEIEIPAPPDKQEQGYARLIQVGLPLITIVGYLLIGTLGGVGRNPLFLIPMALSVFASVGFSIYSYFKEKQQLAEATRAYDERLAELNKEMHNYHDLQRRFYRYNYPDMQTTLRIVQKAHAFARQPSLKLRSENRLWERRTTDEDFGVVRLGMGTLPSTVIYTVKDIENFDDPQARAAMKLADDSRHVSDIPVIISLCPPKGDEATEDEGGSEVEEVQRSRTPTLHTVGIAGDSRSVYDLSRSLVLQAVTFQAPSDVRLYVLGKRREPWTWVDELPHSQGGPTEQYTCFLSDIDSSQQNVDEDDEGPVGNFLERLRKLLSQRSIRLQDNDSNSSDSDPTLPMILLVVDLLDTAYDDSSLLSLDQVERNPAISILLDSGAQLGAAAIFLLPERSKIPSKCRGVIEVERTTPASNSKLEQFQKLHYRYAETGVNSFRYVGEAASLTENHAAIIEDVSKVMAGLQIRQSAGGALASSVPFMDLMGFSSLDDLQEKSWQRWQSSVEPTQADWLRVKVGLMSGNKPRTLVFSAKRDGVHGMVAGSTGSGKSELLISMITAMSVTYDPSVLNFVLVDYKGGGAFNEFKDLPHCVDIITNLEGDGVTRMFTAINSEMKRRQALNVSTKTKDIVDYRKKGLHLEGEPYPYLFIIIDEFAEMIADRPEYKNELESITRVGRAQGVSLILAAQRPTGVTDQMRSNIKFRISLRVETQGESREMLRRTEAAFLPSDIPGRGYLQVGNEEIELIQVAYTGEKYDTTQPTDAKVIWPDRRPAASSSDNEPPELYKVIIKTLHDLAEDNECQKQYAPWPEALPRNLSLSSALISEDKIETVTSERYLVGVEQITLGQLPDSTLTLNPSLERWQTGENGWITSLDWLTYALRPVVGLIDNPHAAKQEPLVIDFQRGHAVIFGGAGWGKTTFLKTVALSLLATHSPNQLHLYILDLGGRSFSAFEEMPHVGAIIIPDEEGYRERVEQLLRMVENRVDERKDLFSEADVAEFVEYNHQHADDPLPAIVVIIDNFIEFRESFGSSKDNVETLLDKLTLIARESRRYGIHFVISANQFNTLPNPLFNLFTERITLKLNDPSEYRAIVGGQVADIQDIAGRGYMKIGSLPLSVQLAQPLDVLDTSNDKTAISQIAATMKTMIADEGLVYQKPEKIDALPKAVLFKHMLARQLKVESDEQFLTHLQNWTRQNWQNSLEAAKADWLETAIGVISGNRLRPMHLEAKKDGVHGLIAGGTGSGKSELLMTLIVDLALRYDPTILNFVLVDYKGGGAFQPFAHLPHCVDIVTNLNKSEVRRMFTAINAEMQRRQKLNAETGTANIVEYREKGLHLSHKPYPHLFIIIDEYAEMITDSPEFRDELDSITRVGRAQGVNLLLASQRPTGVSDQMRANIKFRICLRVEGVDTSREMLRRSDAAFLPNGMPGRGYLQVGNENIELMQLAYTGEDYPYSELNEKGQRPKFYEMVVNMAQELHEAAPPMTPWPPALPQTLTLAPAISQTETMQIAAERLARMLAQYLDREYAPFIDLQHQPPTRLQSLNPAVEDWLSGRPAWHTVNWQKAAMRAVVGLVDDPYNARLLPLLIDLTRGHAVLFGSSGWGKTTFLRTVVTSLAATHSPDEFQAHILDLGGRNLITLQELPHVGSVIMPDERGYEEQVQQLLRKLNEFVDARKNQFSVAKVSTLYDYNQKADKVEPAILIVIDNFAEFMETFGNVNQKDNEDSVFSMLVALMRQAKAYGIHFVITADRVNVLSSKLYSLFTERLTLKLSDTGEYSAVVSGQVPDLPEIRGRGYIRVERQPLEFQIAVAVGEFDQDEQLDRELDLIAELGQKMERFGQSSWSGKNIPFRIGALPQASMYRQLLADQFELDSGVDFWNGLAQQAAARWAENAQPAHADWLKVALGIVSGNQTRILELEAKKDGVHGLIAGGTGAGKSELLMTMIIGLALNYSPDILNFVLVDYKGGGAFKPFETMPHCVDMISNLNKAGVDRMFAAINAEMRRRQGLNADTGTKDIVEYREKGQHLNGGEPYPHLVIIIDEYAEMIDDNPEYRAQLESITRVGRAQGVNLILASQRPKGVSDQMRANIKLRVCLRVEQAETSREMLRRPDAASLPSIPGRGYIQAGNENLELIQVSWAGEKVLDKFEAPLHWPDREGDAAAAADEEAPKLFEKVVAMTSQLYGGQMARKPWPSFLPTTFSLQSTLLDATRNEAFTLLAPVTAWTNGDGVGWPGVDWRTQPANPVVGLVDNAAEAYQRPLRFDFSRNHLAIFGDAGMGKSSLLRTIAVSLATTHSPNEFHAYALDLGGRSLRNLESLPHVGAVLYADEEKYEERQERLLSHVARMIEQRQQVFSQADVADFYEYNARHPEQALPVVLLLIDNFAELRENYEMLVDNTVTPLIRRSLGAGIAFVVTANTPNNLSGKLYNLFGERITLKQTNSDLYMDIVGRGAIPLDDVPGRGYIRQRKRPLPFQTALPVGLFDETGQDEQTEATELQRIGGFMTAYTQSSAFSWREQPHPIPSLPSIVPLRAMLTDADAPNAVRVQAVLGQSGALQPALFDLRRLGPHFAIIGPPLSGKTTTLYNWVISLAQRYSPQQVKMVLIDLQRKLTDYGGQHRLNDIPHVLLTISDVEQVEILADKLKAECAALENQESQAELFIMIDNYDDLADDLAPGKKRRSELDESIKVLLRLIRQYGTRGVHLVAAGSFDSRHDLNRLIFSANYGIGLRTADPLNKLKVSRIPSNLQGNELEMGRGYIVKSGQIQTVQVATPYQHDDQPHDELALAEKLPQMLDQWVTSITEQYPNQQAVWADGTTTRKELDTLSPTQDKEIVRMLSVLKAYMHHEMQASGTNGQSSDITRQFMALEATAWHDQKSLRPLLLTVWKKLNPAIESMADTIASTGFENVLTGIENNLPTDNGQ